MPASSDLSSSANTSSSANNERARNLFLEADPAFDALTKPGTWQPSALGARTPPGRRRGRGLVVPLDAPSTTSTPARSPEATLFTRRDTALGRLRAVPGHRLRQADVTAGRLLGRLTARRYGALGAAAVLSGLLVLLTWAGLAARDASTARTGLDQRLARAVVTVSEERARIDSLSAQLRQAALATSRPPATTTATTAPPGSRQAAKRKPKRLNGAHDRHRSR